MFGRIVWREKKMPFVTVQNYCGVPFLTVAVERGDGLRAQYSLRRAVRRLRRGRVHAAAFPKDMEVLAPFTQAGIFPPDIFSLREKKAEEIVRCAMRQRGIEPSEATVVLTGEHWTPALARAAEELARAVRYLHLSFRDGGVSAAQWLYREYGVASVVPGKPADLTADFTHAAVSDDALSVGDLHLPIRYATAEGEEYEEAVLAVLCASGAVDPQTLRILQIGANTA